MWRTLTKMSCPQQLSLRRSLIAPRSHKLYLLDESTCNEARQQASKQASKPASKHSIGQPTDWQLGPFGRPAARTSRQPRSAYPSAEPSARLSTRPFPICVNDLSLFKLLPAKPLHSFCSQNCPAPTSTSSLNRLDHYYNLSECIFISEHSLRSFLYFKPP